MSFFLPDAVIDNPLQYIIDNASLTVVACSGDPTSAAEVEAQKIATATVAEFIIFDNGGHRALKIPALSLVAVASGIARHLCIVDAGGEILVKSPIMTAGIFFDDVGAIISLAQSSLIIQEIFV